MLERYAAFSENCSRMQLRPGETALTLTLTLTLTLALTLALTLTLTLTLTNQAKDLGAHAVEGAAAGVKSPMELEPYAALTLP